MQQTERYELNQWDPEDRILREDFNADNQKIDAALAGKLGRPELFHSFLFPGSPTTYSDYNLKQIAWADWEFVLMHVFFRENQVPEGRQIKVSFNQGAGELVTIPWGDFYLLLWPKHNLEEKVHTLFVGSQIVFRPLTLQYKNLSTFTMERVTQDFPSSFFKFYGFR